MAPFSDFWAQKIHLPLLNIKWISWPKSQNLDLVGKPSLQGNCNSTPKQRQCQDVFVEFIFFVFFHEFDMPFLNRFLIFGGNVL